MRTGRERAAESRRRRIDPELLGAFVRGNNPMKSRARVLFSLLGVLAISACGAPDSKSSGSGGAGGNGGNGGEPLNLSCTLLDGSVCSLYTALGSGKAADSVKEQCGIQHGTTGTTCETAGLLGCCALTQTGGGVSVCYYSGGFISHDTAKMTCAQTTGGSWSEPKSSSGSGG
jgi:hypothetical protein